MSVSYYAIVRHVPDPIRGEFTNIGVVVVSDEGGYWGLRLRDDWSACEPDIMALLDDPGTPPNRTFVQRLRYLAVHWQNVIQFSDVRPSVKEPPEALLDELYDLMVAPKTVPVGEG